MLLGCGLPISFRQSIPILPNFCLIQTFFSQMNYKQNNHESLPVPQDVSPLLLG